MFESDADRLAMLRGLGGVSVDGPRGQFVGLYENEFVQVDALVDSSSPRLTARTMDVASAGVSIGSLLRVGPDVFAVRSVQPDGTGMTAILLEIP